MSDIVAGKMISDNYCVELFRRCLKFFIPLSYASTVLLQCIMSTKAPVQKCSQQLQPGNISNVHQKRNDIFIPYNSFSSIKMNSNSHHNTDESESCSVVKEVRFLLQIGRNVSVKLPWRNFIVGNIHYSVLGGGYIGVYKDISISLRLKW